MRLKNLWKITLLNICISCNYSGLHYSSPTFLGDLSSYIYICIFLEKFSTAWNYKLICLENISKPWLSFSYCHYNDSISSSYHLIWRNYVVSSQKKKINSSLWCCICRRDIEKHKHQHLPDISVSVLLSSNACNSTNF